MVSADALTGARSTVVLLREVNAWNRTLRAGRVVLGDDGVLQVQAQVRAQSLEPGELGTLVDEVARCAGALGPVVHVVHGSRGGPGPVSDRGTADR